MAHQQLSSTISFEARMAKAKTDFELPNQSLRIVRLEASHIGGKLAREVKAAHMNSLKAVLNLAKEARVMCTSNGWTINPKGSHRRS